MVAIGHHQVAQPDDCADIGCGPVRGQSDAGAQFTDSHITASTTTTPITRYAAPAFGMAPIWRSVTVSMWMSRCSRVRFPLLGGLALRGL